MDFILGYICYLAIHLLKHKSELKTFRSKEILPTFQEIGLCYVNLRCIIQFTRMSLASPHFPFPLPEGEVSYKGLY